MASMASIALPPSARMERPATTVAKCGAQTTPRRCPALCKLIGLVMISIHCSGWSGEAAFAKKRVRGRQPTAERFVGFGRVLPATGGIDAIAQTFRGGGVENVAGLRERGKCVGVEHFRPHIAVIASGITAAGEDMGKVRQAMPHHDFVWHADPGKACRFEGARV